MPILKPISGHTGCRNVRKYLEKNGRAIARDFFNLSWDEREMSSYDQAGKEAVEWDREMDQMRASFGNDAPCKGRKARTYKHFVISPDPEDDIDIDALRGIASDWALRFFGDHQIAIVYHDDNANGIPHAHVVMASARPLALLARVSWPASWPTLSIQSNSFSPLSSPKSVAMGWSPFSGFFAGTSCPSDWFVGCFR